MEAIMNSINSNPTGALNPEPGHLASHNLFIHLSNRVIFQFSRSVMSNSLRPHGLQLARHLCPSLSPGVCSNSCLLSWWCQPTISFSVVPFSFALNLSQHQGLSQWVSSSHQVAKVSELRALIQWLVSLSRPNAMTGVFLRRHSEKGDACRAWDWSHTATRLQSRKSHGKFIPKAFRVTTVLPTPWFQTSSF